MLKRAVPGGAEAIGDEVVPEDGMAGLTDELLKLALEVRTVEVRVRNSVDLTTIVLLPDEETETKLDTGVEPVGITAMALVLELPAFVNDDGEAGAAKHGEYPP